MFSKSFKWSCRVISAAVLLWGPVSVRAANYDVYVLAGQSNKAIARNLHITESTVKMHFKNVMRKINAQNRTQAAVWAIQNGLSPLVSA